MILLIAGSRSIKEFDLSPYIPKETEIIVSGGAEGIDALAEEYADKNRLSKVVFRPQYAKFGRAAPIVRNEEMVKVANSVLVIWDGKSKGTLSTVNFAKKSNKPIVIINTSEQ